VRALLCVLALLLSAPTLAQEEAPLKKKPAAKKQATKKQPKAHAKPTPEQVRKFNELEKKKAQ